jgi:hypothetical protein
MSSHVCISSTSMHRHITELGESLQVRICVGTINALCTGIHTAQAYKTLYTNASNFHLDMHVHTLL